ncbi:MAG: type II toxin-antitoxin system RelE/ParE family toxin [Candidatus Diapherotrites archaeon]
MYELLYSDTAKKQLDKLENHVQERILTALERTRINPFLYFFKLTGREFSRMRIGDYRIVADITKQKLEILIIKVGKRENVYDSI